MSRLNFVNRPFRLKLASREAERKLDEASREISHLRME